MRLKCLSSTYASAMNKIVPILIVVVILVAVAGFLVLYHPPSSSSSETSSATSSSPTPSTGSSSPSNSVSGSNGISMTVKDENITPYFLYQGFEEQAYLVIVSVHNSRVNPIYVNGSSFFLDTSGGVENVSYLAAIDLSNQLGQGVSSGIYDDYSTEVLPGQTATIELPFTMPIASTPEKVELVYGGSTIYTSFPSPVSYISAIETVNMKFSGQHTDVSLTSISPLNYEGYNFSGQEVKVYFQVSNEGSSPFQISSIQVSSPFTLLSDNASGVVVPAGSEEYFVANVKMPTDEAYYGPITVSVLQGTSLHFLTMNTTGYSLDTADAIDLGYNGFSYLIFNVSLTYSGPGELSLNPHNFVLVTNQGDYSASYGTPASRIFVYLSYEDVVSGESIHGSVAFRVPIGTKPLTLEYNSSGQTIASVNVNPTPSSTVTYLNYVSANATSSYIDVSSNTPTVEHYLNGEEINVSVQLESYSPFTVNGVKVGPGFTLVSEGPTIPTNSSSSTYSYTLNTWVVVEVNNESYYGYLYLTFETSQ